MKILFIHQNCPGQYKHLAPYMARDPANEVVFLTQPKKRDVDGVRKVEYKPWRKPAASTHHYVRTFEDGVLHGQGAGKAAMAMKKEGFYPDVVCAHMGWGEGLYIKDVWPRAALLGYLEWFYEPIGRDVGFYPDDNPSLDDVCRIRSRNALHLMNLQTLDRGITPTRWQLEQHPKAYRHKMSVIHDGVDTETLIPNCDVTGTVEGHRLRAGDEIVTYVARELEPYRGFPIFMRAAEQILKRRPHCHILVVGGDGVSYGKTLPDGRSYRQAALEEVDIDPSRLHFLGKVPYERYIRILQLSSAHIYLTVPFVLSWSMLEAMAVGCLVIGSRTPPVEEVITHERNGLLVDFFSPDEIAERVDQVLDHPDGMQAVRARARQTILDRYSLATCLPRQAALIRSVAESQALQPKARTASAARRSQPAAPRGPAVRRKSRRRKGRG